MGEVLYAATQFRTRPVRRPSSRRATVLLVDPDPATLAAMEQALGDEGFVTATAFDGAGAVAASHRLATIDVLITSVHTDEMDAVELADVLRRRHPEMQVLYVTVCADEVEEQVPLSEDDDFIEKPFSGVELVEAVSSLLR